jgi:hypothetical protein
MFGYIKQVDVEIAQEPVRAFGAEGENAASEAVVTEERPAGFWGWWISLYRPGSRPTTAYL